MFPDAEASFISGRVSTTFEKVSMIAMGFQLRLLKDAAMMAAK
jgi:hypothetical protein